MNGLGTDSVRIDWEAATLSEEELLEEYAAGATISYELRIAFEVAGAPDTPVLVEYTWNNLVITSTEHEAGDEDFVAIGKTQLWVIPTALSGEELLGGRFNIEGPGGGTRGFSLDDQQGSFLAHVGDAVTLAVTGSAVSLLADPPPGPADASGTHQRGDITLVVSPQNQSQNQPTFVRGDSRADGDVALTDALFTLGCLFRGGPCSPCPDAADANDSGRVDMADAIFTLRWLFQGGPPPPEPTPSRPNYPPTDCDYDRTPDLLSCPIFPPCGAHAP